MASIVLVAEETSSSVGFRRSPRSGGLTSLVDEKRGKGSHVTLHFGSRLTVVRKPKDELKTGTLHAMCKQLGLEKEDL